MSNIKALRIISAILKLNGTMLCKMSQAIIWSVLHLAPGINKDFKRVTSPDLKHLGDSAVDVWKKIVIDDDLFISQNSQNIEDLFGALPLERYPSLQPCWAYINERYAWVVQG